MDSTDFSSLSKDFDLRRVRNSLIVTMVFDTVLASAILLIYLYSVVGMTYDQLKTALLGFLWIGPLTMVVYGIVVFLYFRPVVEFIKRFRSHEATDRITIINAQGRIMKGPPAVSLAGFLFWLIGSLLMAVWMINQAGISTEKGMLLVLGGIIAAFATNSHSLYRLKRIVRPFNRLLSQQSQASKEIYKEATSSIRTRFYLNLLSLILFSLFFSYLTIFSETLFLLKDQTRIHLENKLSEMSTTIIRFMKKEKIDEIAPYVDDIVVGENGSAFLIDTSGGQVTTSHIDTQLYRELKDKILRATSTQFVEYGKKNILVAFSRVADSPYYIGVMSNKSENIPNIRKFALTSLLVIAVCLILSFAMAGASSEDIVEPINELIQEVLLISEGELDHPIYTGGTDEIGVLAGTFEKMRVSLKKQMREKSKKVKELTTLYEMGQQLEKSKGLDSKLNILLTNIVYKLNYDRAVLLKYNKKTESLDGVEIRGNNPSNLNPRELSLPLSDSQEIIVNSFKSKTPVLVEDAFNDSRVSENMNNMFQSKSFITIPIITVNETIGIVVVDNNTTDRTFTQEDFRILCIITNQVIASINASH